MHGRFAGSSTTTTKSTPRPALESLRALAARSACATLDAMTAEEWHEAVGPTIPDEILQQMIEAGQADRLLRSRHLSCLLLPQLTHLDLGVLPRSFVLTPRLLACLPARCPDLAVLCLRGCRGLSASGARAVFEHPRSRGGLHEIDAIAAASSPASPDRSPSSPLSSTSASASSPSSSSASATTLGALRVLDLSACGELDDAAAVVFVSSCPRLNTLKCSFCPLLQGDLLVHALVEQHRDRVNAKSAARMAREAARLRHQAGEAREAGKAGEEAARSTTDASRACTAATAAAATAATTAADSTYSSEEAAEELTDTFTEKPPAEGASKAARKAYFDRKVAHMLLQEGGGDTPAVATRLAWGRDEDGDGDDYNDYYLNDDNDRVDDDSLFHLELQGCGRLTDAAGALAVQQLQQLRTVLLDRSPLIAALTGEAIIANVAGRSQGSQQVAARLPSAITSSTSPSPSFSSAPSALSALSPPHPLLEGGLQEVGLSGTRLATSGALIRRLREAMWQMPIDVRGRLTRLRVGTGGVVGGGVRGGSVEGTGARATGRRRVHGRNCGSDDDDDEEDEEDEDEEVGDDGHGAGCVYGGGEGGEGGGDVSSSRVLRKSRHHPYVLRRYATVHDLGREVQSYGGKSWCNLCRGELGGDGKEGRSGGEMGGSGAAVWHSTGANWDMCEACGAEGGATIGKRPRKREKRKLGNGAKYPQKGRRCGGVMAILAAMGLG